MKKTITVIMAVAAYATLKEAKLTQMEDAEKFDTILAMRSLKKVAADYEDFAKDAQEKLKPENFSDLQDRAQRFEQLTDEEKLQVNRELQAYNAKVEECVNPEREKMTEVEFQPLSKDAFTRLMKSNDFTASTALTLYDVLCG
ncbi:MAG: hypothetical protein NC311_09670 [Muribaculaceae bacterium]|nr:hypothetical protein [Muribaculaceae bacterium]